MASAMPNMQNNQYFTFPGPEPEPELLPFYTYPAEYCETLNPMWPFLDENNVNNFEWIGQPIGDLDMAQMSELDAELLPNGQITGTDVNLQEFWPPGNTLQAYSHPVETPSQPYPYQASDFISNVAPFMPSYSPPPPYMLPSINPTSTSQSPFLMPPSPQPSPPSPPISSTTYTCAICQPTRSFSTPGLLKRHEKTHTKPIACLFPTCSRHFAENKDMHRHVSVHHPSLGPSQEFLCPENG